MSDRRRNLFVLLVVLGLLVASLAVVLPGLPPKKETKLGLDLQGGVQLVYEARPTKQQPTVTNDGLQRSLDIMRERVDQFGVAEPELLRTGANQIEVDLPGVADAERAARQVGTTAQLYFYDWEPNVLDENCRTNPEQINGGQTAITGLYNAVKRASKCKPQVDSNNTTSGPIYYAFDKTSHRPLNDGIPDERRSDLVSDLRKQNKLSSADILSVPEGIIVVRNEDQRPTDQQTGKVDAWWVLRDNPVLSGTDIKNPEQNFDQQGGGEPIVTMEFTGKGRKAFAATTRAIAQRGADNAALNGGLTDPIGASHHFAIRLDNELISTPYINFRENPDGIDGQNGAQISGGFTIQSAQDLAKLLKIVALPLRLELISRSQVSATLGKQALHQGLIAGLAGFAIVAIFLIVFYRVLGVIATLALGVYAIYLFALIKLIPITLTLPGIAGLILTIGVAADANIVIFERVKEEVRAGRSISAGIAQGYKKGLSAIIDANVVTFMVAFILFILATAGVKGFAFVLGIGTLTSLFTAVLATQAVLGTMQRSRMITHPTALGVPEDATPKRRWTQDFMGASKWFFSMSGVILLIGALAIGGKGLNFGIDFESGTRVKAAFVQNPNENQVRDALQTAGFESPEVQRITSDKELKGDGFQISLGETGPQVSKIQSVLSQKFGQPKAYQANSIGPTFGKTVANSAIIAIIASLIVISAYIALRFEWKYAVPVLIALMHDLLITAGVYSLTGREVTTSTVAALLTILGYSLYDTIIVFDRIRENVPRMPRAAFSQIVNRSMSEVLTRSLATSFCTALPIFSLMLFGGDTLKDFAFALLVGPISGASWSVFIPPPVLTHGKEREPVYAKRRRRIESELGFVPAYATAVGGGAGDGAPQGEAEGSRSTPRPRRSRRRAGASPRRRSRARSPRPSSTSWSATSTTPSPRQPRP